jgi:dipeptidyl aminopeptidase/acylaminoacyl peptidase
MMKKLILLLFVALVTHASTFTPQDVLKTKYVNEVAISPDGEFVAYTVIVPREATDDPGSSFRELYVASVETGESRPYITEKSSLGSIAWSPDGSMISFREKRGDNKYTQVWGIPLNGGEARQLTKATSSVSLYQWHPNGEEIAYVATTPTSKKEKALTDKGYGFIYFEENLKDRNLYIAKVDSEESRQLTQGVSVWDFQFNNAGSSIAAAISPKNLVDHSYMFKKIYVIDVASGDKKQVSKNEGKLGNFMFSPDDLKLVYNAALERKDHANSQAYVMDVDGGNLVNVTPEKFRGHINWVSWADDNTVLYKASEGVWPTLSTVPASGGKRTVIYNSKDTGVVIENVSHTADAKQFAFMAGTTTIHGELYVWQPKNEIKQLTNQNPWMSERQFGEQKVVTYKARDGREVEALLIYPVDYNEGQTYPLIVNVHGGPESNFSNNMRRTTSYSIAGQVLAGRGYVIFYPNYGASTGYGVDFALVGYEDAAGKEFDDIADGIDFLVNEGIADKDRVGLGGGSYGGYASAWFASYYTEKVKAVCMFVGISNLISKRSTTDIPYEELYVHSGQKLEEMWQHSLERSPVYWAHQSKTAVHIAGGAADTRVHPSQSLEFYRRLKMNDHPAVRLVQYPGEGHGNSKQPRRIDYLYRHLAWYDWYVKDAKPIDGPMPPLDLSEFYGLDVEE